MDDERQRLEAGVAALEAQRVALGDAVVDASIAALRARLDALVAPALKQVSIVFADLVGSTSRSQRLDPEAIQAAVDGTLARLTQVVEAHGGKVLQYAGDNLLAAFGAVAVREDDAERAVRCALALVVAARGDRGGVRSGRRIAADRLAAPGGGGDTETRGDAGFEVRVGVHTGAVLLGGGVDGEASIRGAAVNIAARMEQAASPGRVRVTRETWTLVRGAFDFEAPVAVDAKGVERPIESRLVIAEKPRHERGEGRGIDGVTAPLIGRDAELEALQAAWARVVDEGRLGAVTVVGEAGVGKSRLVDAFERRREARSPAAAAFVGRAQPQTRGRPYGLLRDIVARRLHLADDDDAAARARIEAALVPLFAADGADVAEANAHLLGHLLGVDFAASRHVGGIVGDPAQLRQRAFHAGARLFRAVAAAGPVVLRLEDLHWADDESLDFIAHLIDADRDLPILLLASARPTLREHRPEWSRGAPVAATIEITPLDRAASRRLVDALLQRLPAVPDALRELIEGGADGIPFYLEERIRILVDDGVIVTGDAWTLHLERLAGVRVPATLTGVLQARLDRLAPAEKRALQQASVIGPTFSVEALDALDGAARAALDTLRSRGFVARVAAVGDGADAHAFGHHLMHQVTYETVLRRDRRKLHGRLADWMAALPGASEELAAVVAGHYEQADRPRPAAEQHARVAEHAAGRMAVAAALAHAERGAALLDAAGADAFDDDREAMALRWRLADVREQMLDRQGRRAEQRAALEQLRELADALDDDARRAHVALRTSIAASVAGEWLVAEAQANQALRLAERAGDDAGCLRAQASLGILLIRRLRLDDAQALAERGREAARERGLKMLEARFLRVLGLIAERRLDELLSIEREREALAIAREIGNRGAEAIGLEALGCGALNLGDPVEARRLLEQSVELHRGNGSLSLVPSALCHLAEALRWQGEDARALAAAREAVELAEKLEVRDVEIALLDRLGDVELSLGRIDAAAATFARAAALPPALGKGWHFDALAGVARVALAEGDHARALRVLEPVLALDADDDGLAGAEYPERVLFTCHLALERAGDARAAEWLARAHGALRAVADRFADPRLRAAVVDSVPHRREIAAAWSRSLRPAG